jgi:serine O-acetyltransferase
MFSRLKEDIAVVFERDPAARTCWEVLTAIRIARLVGTA